MKILGGICTLALIACGGSADNTSPIGNGPLKLGIVSGQNQTVTAGSAQLGAPVVGKLVRQPNGTVAFIQTSAGRALDLIVPRAFAQGGTVVTGSPVPGAVVCAVSVDTAHSLVPFTPCTNTDSAGQATFYFTPGHGAGVAKAEIRGTLNNSPAVFDTAKATVLPGPITELGVGTLPNRPVGPDSAYLSGNILHVKPGQRIALREIALWCRDQYANMEPTCPLSWAFYAGDTPDAQRVAQVTSDTATIPTGVAASGSSSWTQILALFSGSARVEVFVHVDP